MCWNVFQGGSRGDLKLQDPLQWRGVNILHEKWCKASWASMKKEIKINDVHKLLNEQKLEILKLHSRSHLAEEYWTLNHLKITCFKGFGLNNSKGNGENPLLIAFLNDPSCFSAQSFLLCVSPALLCCMSLTSDDVQLLDHLLPVGKFSLHLILEVIWETNIQTNLLKWCRPAGALKKHQLWKGSLTVHLQGRCVKNKLTTSQSLYRFIFKLWIIYELDNIKKNLF